MKIYRKVYTHLKTGAEVVGKWKTSGPRAMIHKIKGEGYMERNNLYSMRIEEKQFTIVSWLINKYRPPI